MHCISICLLVRVLVIFMTLETIFILLGFYHFTSTWWNTWHMIKIKRKYWKNKRINEIISKNGLRSSSGISLWFLYQTFLVWTLAPKISFAKKQCNIFKVQFCVLKLAAFICPCIHFSVHLTILGLGVAILWSISQGNHLPRQHVLASRCQQRSWSQGKND